MKKTPDTSMRGRGWLLFFYSVPAKPTANRLKVWRRLVKAGAVQLKGAVYALPYSDEHHELFQWLASEVVSMKGGAAFVRVERIETMKDKDLAGMFNRQVEEAYRSVGKRLDELQRKVNAVRNASVKLKDRSVTAGLDKCSRQFEEIRKTDFFTCGAGRELQNRLAALAADVEELAGPGVAEKEPETIPRRVEEYRGRVWLTRKRPFIDRMASAWLIRRFIDKDAVFRFMDEDDVEAVGGESVAYDVRGGEFTHVGGLCTFEVMVKSFGLKDRAVKAIAEVVHDLDVKDDRYKSPEAAGVEAVLAGLRDMVADDAEALEKGMAVFEMLYLSRR